MFTWVKLWLFCAKITNRRSQFSARVHDLFNLTYKELKFLTYVKNTAHTKQKTHQQGNMRPKYIATVWLAKTVNTPFQFTLLYVSTPASWWRHLTRHMLSRRLWANIYLTWVTATWESFTRNQEDNWDGDCLMKYLGDGLIEWVNG